MISKDHIRLMARYNQWQNRSLYRVADGLDDAARQRDRGAFFRSIQGTLNHILWGDMIWLHRFHGTDKPAGGIKDSPGLFADWQALKAARLAFDTTIRAFADGLDPGWVTGDETWFSGAAGREVTKPRWILVTHLFNHQTHHRGQVHAMLTAAGAKPDDTDLFMMPDEV